MNSGTEAALVVQVDPKWMNLWSVPDPRCAQFLHFSCVGGLFNCYMYQAQDIFTKETVEISICSVLYGLGFRCQLENRILPWFIYSRSSPLLPLVFIFFAPLHSCFQTKNLGSPNRRTYTIRSVACRNNLSQITSMRSSCNGL